MILKINHKQIPDFDIRTRVAITFTMSSITEIDAEKTGFTTTIKVPDTPPNRDILGLISDTHNPELFNQQGHFGELEEDTWTVCSGMVRLVKSEINYRKASWHHFKIIGAGKEWAIKASEKFLSEINLQFNQYYTEQHLLNSWNSDLLKWFPVVRAPFSYREAGKVIERPMTIYDYHPFISAKALFLQIFKDAGCEVKSNFIDSGGLDNLFISGFLNRANIQDQKRDWDFKATSFKNYDVNTIAYMRTVAIADTSDPDATENGNYAPEVFENKGKIRTETAGGEKKTYYIPDSDSHIGFRLNIRYTTGVKYKASSEVEPYYYRPVWYNLSEYVDGNKILRHTEPVESLLDYEIGIDKNGYLEYSLTNVYFAAYVENWQNAKRLRMYSAGNPYNNGYGKSSVR
jgi:hypothetical protein